MNSHDNQPRGRGFLGCMGALTVVLALLTLLVYGAAKFLGLDDVGGKKKPVATASAPAGGSKNAKAAATGFLAAWSAGDWVRAAGFTDSPDEAARALGSFNDGLEITARKLTADDPESADVPFKAVLDVKGLGPWTYDGAVPTAESSGGWKVRWGPAVLHPKLTADTRLSLGRGDAVDSVKDTGAVAQDRNGKRLTGADHATLRPILAKLVAGQPAEDTAPAAGVPPYGRIELLDKASGRNVATLAELGTPPAQPAAQAGTGPKTTLDLDAQTAAEKAVTQTGKPTAFVALDIKTGGILAVANAQQNTYAFSGATPPGSTMKIITTAALLKNGAVTPNSKVECPAKLIVGKEFTNDDGMSITGPDATFRQSFARSCNTAFIGLRGKLGDGELSSVASDYFGIGGDWQTGFPNVDGKVPPSSGPDDKAAQMIGQGTIQMNALTMASVVATAKSGQFRQPVLLSDGLKVHKAPKKLPAEVSKQLTELMRATVTEGSAKKTLGGLSGVIGAKTGTAEVGGNKVNDGWMVAFRGDVAVACYVEGGDSGAAAAGPVLKSFFTDYK